MKARYFNNISVNDNIVTKSSTDIYKIKSEFKYYYLLPDDLKPFFVKPFNYRENETHAMYDMEYSGITLYEFIYKNSQIFNDNLNLAINKIIKQLNLYFNTRNKYTRIKDSKDFVYTKVIKRFDMLKKLPEYQKIEATLKLSNKNLEDLISKFTKKYYSLPKIKQIQTIAHGDLHFSNILVNERTYEIKFIDVKGAMKTEDLFMDSYYDLAKLYHSIEGLYDLIINDKYDIKLQNDLKYSVEVTMKSTIQREVYKEIYNELYSKLSNDELKLVTIYTASLFLSMLPLHKDNLKRIIAFIEISTNFLEDKKYVVS